MPFTFVDIKGEVRSLADSAAPRDRPTLLPSFYRGLTSYRSLSFLCINFVFINTTSHGWQSITKFRRLGRSLSQPIVSRLEKADLGPRPAEAIFALLLPTLIGIVHRVVLWVGKRL